MNTYLRKENIILYAFIGLMALATSGLPYVRLAYYGLPFLAIVVWIMSGRLTVNLSRPIAPFLLLILLGIISLVPWDYNSFKKTYFIFVFTTVFLLFDFSQTKVDMRKLGAFFVALAILKLILVGKDTGVEFSIADSKSAFESTFAFPIGLIGIFLFIKKQYLWSLISLACVLIFLKRIVLLAIVLSILVWILPKKIRKFVLNPWTVTTVTFLITVLSINFSYGEYNEIIREYTGKAANDLSKGRESLWYTALTSVEFSYTGFALWGVGIGKVVTFLQTEYRVDRILLHNDLLSIMLEIGLFFYLVFVFLLNAVKTEMQRLMSLFLTMLFVTDNVLIYQHVMFVYLLIQQRLSSDPRN